MIRIHKAITTVMGLGYAPVAPGTFGTAGAFLFCYGLMHFQGAATQNLILIVMSIILTIVGIYSTNQVSPEWGDDPGKVVVDEFVGYLITMIAVPFTLKNLLLAFVLFRFFDILKPLGIRYLDKNLKGGTGVMLDDVLAGIYASGVLHLWIWLEPQIWG